MSEIWINVLVDGLFAAVAGLGFAFMQNPPKRTIIFSAILASLGHAFRYYLIHSLGFDIAIASFLAALSIGLCGMLVAKQLKTPVEIIAFPALLPMIPGMYAYKTILASVSFANAKTLTQQSEAIAIIFENLMTTISISLALAVGISMTLLVFYERSLMMTRGR